MTFENDRIYPSAIKGRNYCVKMKFRVQDTDCLLVYLDSYSTLFSRTGYYYPAIVEEDGRTATVLLDEGFTTIYAEEEE